LQYLCFQRRDHEHFQFVNTIKWVAAFIKDKENIRVHAYRKAALEEMFASAILEMVWIWFTNTQFCSLEFWGYCLPDHWDQTWKNSRHLLLLQHFILTYLHPLIIKQPSFLSSDQQSSVIGKFLSFKVACILLDLLYITKVAFIIYNHYIICSF
jgi:hypothetical protein